MDKTDNSCPEQSRRKPLKTDIVLKYRELNKFINLKLSEK